MKCHSRTLLITIITLSIIISSDAQAQFGRRSKVVRSIRKGNVERVEDLVSNGTVNTNKSFFNRNTLVGEVINANISQKDKIKIIESLIKNTRSSINEQINIGRSKKSYPLMVAIQRNELELAKRLIDLGAFVHVMDSKWNSPLSETIKLLMKCPVNSDSYQNTVNLAEYIVEAFPWSVTIDPAMTDDEMAYDLYTKYTYDPIKECIRGAWPEVLEPIIGSALSNNELVTGVLRKTIEANQSKALKKGFMKSISNELIKRQINVDNITYVNNQGVKETPIEMAVRMDDAGAFVALTDMGAEKPSISFVERNNALNIKKIMKETTINKENILSILSEYNYGFDSQDFEEQMDAAISRMNILDEYKIGDKELKLFFGEKNEFGVRTGGVFDYCLDNLEEGNNMSYMALIGVLCYQDQYVRSERYISTTIINGYKKSGLMTLESWLLAEKLKVKEFIIPGTRVEFIKTIDLIKGAKVPAVKGALY